MRKIFISCCALAMLTMVSACGAIPWNSQVDAGITKATIELGTAKDGTPYIKKAELVDGKERADSALHISHPGGWKVDYTVAQSKAFTGQQIRGAVEQAISGDLKAVSPGIVEAITNALIKALVPGAGAASSASKTILPAPGVAAPADGS